MAQIEENKSLPPGRSPTLVDRARALYAQPRVKALAGEFLRFAMVGGLATVIHYAILVSLKELAKAPLLLATSLGYTAGAIFSYTLNRRITFSHQPHFGRGLVKYVVTGFIGLALNGVIVTSLAGLGLPYLLAQMVATGVVLVWNFTVARLLVFRG